MRQAANVLTLCRDGFDLARFFADTFAYIGFRTPDNERLDPNAARTGNGPSIGRLPGDEFGHWWNTVGRGSCRYQSTGELVGVVEVPLESPPLEPVEREALGAQSN